jgi:hypothetical protein
MGAHEKLQFLKTSDEDFVPASDHSTAGKLSNMNVNREIRGETKESWF